MTVGDLKGDREGRVIVADNPSGSGQDHNGCISSAGRHARHCRRSRGVCHPDEVHRCAAVSDRRPSGSSYSQDMSEPLLPLRRKRNDHIKGSGAVTTSKQVEEANTFNVTGYFEHV